MTDKETGGPAFPAQFFDERATGMTLRDFFAAQMLASVFSSTSRVEPKLKDIAAACYRAADAMLEARK